MKQKIQFLLLLAAAFIFNLGGISAQNKSQSPDGARLNTEVKSTNAAIDFTVIDTQGDTLNLFTALDQGKTVFLDFFYTTCSFCIQYSPIIEQVYQNHGAGTGDIVFWGLDYGNTNAQVDAYKATYNVSNPCASGLQGNANQAISYYTSNFNFTGYPTYTIICPDRTVHWDVNYPPNTTGFNTYFSQCGATALPESIKTDKPGIRKIYPVPATDRLNLDISLAQPAKVRLEVYDLLGIRVMQKNYDLLPKGSQSLNLELGGIRAGTYFVKLIRDGAISDIRKFTKTE